VFKKFYNINFITIAGLIVCFPHFNVGTIGQGACLPLLPVGFPVAVIWYLFNKYIIKGEQAWPCDLNRRSFRLGATEDLGFSMSSHHFIPMPAYCSICRHLELLSCRLSSEHTEFVRNWSKVLEI
jgi:hypothetical protein